MASEIVTETMKDGSVEIRMSGSTPSDWFMLLQSALDNIHEALNEADPGAMSDDDQQVYEWVECWVREAERLNHDLENEIEMQKSESRCEFFYGPKRR